MRQARRHAAVTWTLSFALLAFAIASRWMFASAERRDGITPELRAIMLRDPAPIPALPLVDHHGRSVTSDALFTGRWSLVFLGFASCPTVCPATLSQLAAVKASLARQFPGTPQPRYVFVSVDPRRDPPPRLASYVATFDHDFIGVTGLPASLAALSDSLTAFHRLGTATPSGDYGVVHSGEVYLIDPAGRAYARFTPPLDVDAIPRQLVALMAIQARAQPHS